MNSKIKVGIVEDHDLFRQGLTVLLDKHFPELEVIFEASNGKELLRALKHYKPDIITLDIEMPGIGGIKLLEILKQRHPKIKVIVISAHKEITAIMEYVARGANSFLPKNCDISEVLYAIQRVYEHGMYYNEAIAKQLAKNGILIPGGHERKITERDIMFLNLLAAKKTDDEIGRLMDIKDEGVYRYKRRLFLKTNTKGVKELLAYAKAHKYIPV